MIFLHRPFASKSEPHLVRKEPSFINETLAILSWEKKKAASFSFHFFSFSLLHYDYCSFKSTMILRGLQFFVIQVGLVPITHDKGDKGLPHLQCFLLLGELALLLLPLAWVSLWLNQSCGAPAQTIRNNKHERYTNSPHFKFGKAPCSLNGRPVVFPQFWKEGLGGFRKWKHSVSITPLNLIVTLNSLVG